MSKDHSRSDILNKESVLQENFNERFDRSPLTPIDESLKAFQSGVGFGNDLKIVKQTDEDYYESFDVRAHIYGYRTHEVKKYPAIRFNYRLKAIGEDGALTAKGRVRVKVSANPTETITYTLLKYAVKPITVNTRIRFNVEYYTLDETNNFRVHVQTLYTAPISIHLEHSVQFDETTEALTLIPFVKTKLSNKTILEQIEERAYRIGEIAYSAANYGVVFSSVVIEDDYPFDVGDDSVKYDHTKPREYQISSLGSFKVLADMDGNEYDLNSFLYYEGFVNAGFFVTRKPITKLFDGRKNEITLMTKREIDNILIPNIDDESEVYMEEKENWKVISCNHSERLVLEVTEEGNLIAKVADVYGSHYLTYNFDDQDSFLSIPFYKVIPTIRFDLTDNYFYQIEVIECTSNIQIFDKKVKVGQVLIESGSALKSLKIFSLFRSEDFTTWEAYYPALNEPGIVGVVNGNFMGSETGKRDLVLYAPEISIPDTVTNVKYTLEIEMKGEEERFLTFDFENQDEEGWGTVAKDKITISSNYHYFEKQEVKDFLFENRIQGLEVLRDSPLVHTATLNQPLINYNYKRYELVLESTNLNVQLMNYPTQIQFISYRYDVTFTARVQQSANSRWSPKIQNGFYYLNQHEYYLPSQFKTEADYADETVYSEGQADFSLQIDIYTLGHERETFECTLNCEKDYGIDSEHFWYDNGWLRPKPSIQTEYYEEYQYKIYYSPVVEMPMEMQTWDMFKFQTQSEGLAYVNVDARVFITQSNEWSDWYQCWSGAGMSNLPSSQFIQFRVTFSPHTINERVQIEETASSAYEFRRLYSEDSTNVSFETGVLRCIDNSRPANFITNIIDYGTEATFRINGEGSSSEIKYYIATADNYNALKKPLWKEVSSYTSITTKRFARLKVEIPASAEVYAIHRSSDVLIKTTGEMGFGGLVIQGSTDQVITQDSFVENCTYSIPYDQQFHVVEPSFKKFLERILRQRGYKYKEMLKFHLKSTDGLVDIRYDEEKLTKPLELRHQYVAVSSYHTPSVNFFANRTVINSIPQQFSPIIVESEEYGPLTEVFFRNKLGTVALRNIESFISEGQRIFTLQFLDYDLDSIEIEIDGEKLDKNNYVFYRDDENNQFFVHVSDNYENVFDYSKVYVRLMSGEERLNAQGLVDLEALQQTKYNYFLEFNQIIPKGAEVTISYCLRNSFVTEIDEEKGTTKLITHTKKPLRKACVAFETNENSNLKTLDYLSLNPIYTGRYQGFIYLTYETFEPKEIRIYANPKRVLSTGHERVAIFIQVVDRYENPVIGEEIEISNYIGTLNFESLVTDQNGVICGTYVAPQTKGEDHLIFTCVSNGIQESLKFEIV